MYILAVSIVLYHNRCAHYSHQWGKKIMSYLNTHSITHVCFMEMKHTLLQNIYICRIFFPTRLILLDIFTPISYRVPTILTFIFSPYKQETKFNIPLREGVIVLTWSCHMLHVTKFLWC